MSQPLSTGIGNLVHHIVGGYPLLLDSIPIGVEQLILTDPMPEFTHLINSLNEVYIHNNNITYCFAWNHIHIQTRWFL